MKTKNIIFAALIAAIYTCLTFFSSALGLAYGPIQFRISEALIMLTYFTPAAVPGLTLGCILSNIASPYGVIDILLGTVATLLSAIVCYCLGKRRKSFTPYIFPIITALFNSFFVGLQIALFTPGKSFFIIFITSALQVGIGELAVCYAIGIPLFLFLKKHYKF